MKQKQMKINKQKQTLSNCKLDELKLIDIFESFEMNFERNIPDLNIKKM
jgi:hypothetical protein